MEGTKDDPPSLLILPFLASFTRSHGITQHATPQHPIICTLQATASQNTFTMQLIAQPSLAQHHEWVAPTPQPLNPSARPSGTTTHDHARQKQAPTRNKDI